MDFIFPYGPFHIFIATTQYKEFWALVLIKTILSSFRTKTESQPLSYLYSHHILRFEIIRSTSLPICLTASLPHPASFINIPSTTLHGDLTNMDFFGDFCLTCDAQTNGSVFCSQACRLAELDNYTSSTPSSPSSPIYCDTKTSHRQSTGSNTGLYLPPALDFSVYRVPSSTSVSTVRSTESSQRRLSEQARNNLNDYVTSFDQTRTLRRRISMQGHDDGKATSKQ